MTTIKGINQGIGDYNAAIQACAGDYQKFMAEYERIAGPVRQELVKQGQTLSGAQELIKTTGEFNVINAIAQETKRRVLAQMYGSGFLSPQPEPTYTVWDTLQCGYVATDFVPTSDYNFTPRYDKAVSLSQPDAIAIAIKIAERRHEQDKVYVLDRDENIMFSTWRPAANRQDHKAIPIFRDC